MASLFSSHPEQESELCDIMRETNHNAIWKLFFCKKLTKQIPEHYENKLKTFRDF